MNQTPTNNASTTLTKTPESDAPNMSSPDMTLTLTKLAILGEIIDAVMQAGPLLAIKQMADAMGFEVPSTSTILQNTNERTIAHFLDFVSETLQAVRDDQVTCELLASHYGAVISAWAGGLANVLGG